MELDPRSSSYLPRWGRLAGVQVQIEVLHLLVALWLHHGTTPTVCRHGCAELHVLRQRKLSLKGGGGTEATAEPYNSSTATTATNRRGKLSNVNFRGCA